MKLPHFLYFFHRSDEMNAIESLVMTQLTAMNSVKQPSLESKHRKITLLWRNT